MSVVVVVVVFKELKYKRQWREEKTSGNIKKIL